MVVTSNKFWESVPDDIRSELEVILDEVTREVNILAEHKADVDRASILSDSKVHITTLTETERQPWKDAMIPIWKNYENEIGVDVLDAAKTSKGNKTQ
ncbi:MAG: C4-dicarboxylate-binding protein DctP [Desulforhopalus sp.]|jgi:C4-dicarboxylate-binding protein DctP